MDIQAATRNRGSDRPWSIETHGIDAIPDQERHGWPRDLFWIWFAANISVLSVTYDGMPLYLLKGAAPLATTGNGVGGVWHVVKLSASDIR